MIEKHDISGEKRMSKKSRLYWLPPRNAAEFFLDSSDDELKKKHPIGYWLFVAVSILVLVAPCVIYSLVNKNSDSNLFLGWVGSFIIGIGLFNFMAIFVNQYLGHLVSIIAIIVGTILVVIT